jgi:hypothetical protein
MMPANADLAAFIRDHFRSVWTLELLLFLKENASTSWPSEALVQALRASDAIVSKSLDVLLAGGLIVSDSEGRVQYAPVTADLGKLVEETQLLYARKPDAVRRLIVSSAGAGLSAFAESFRLRRD